MPRIIRSLLQTRPLRAACFVLALLALVGCALDQPASDAATPAPPPVPTAATPTAAFVQPALGPNATPLPSSAETVRLRQVAEAASQQIQQTPGTIVHPTSDENCRPVLTVQDPCQLVVAMTPLVRPEWQALFPHTDFVLVNSAYALKTGGVNDPWSWQTDYRVLAIQDGRQYLFKNFAQLLDTNGIVITDQNRELVTKSVALMTLGAYLQNEIRFEEPKTIHLPARVGSYTYQFTVWTKVRGLKLFYLFSFAQGRLNEVSGQLAEVGTGTYIADDQLPLPITDETNYVFIGR